MKFFNRTSKFFKDVFFSQKLGVGTDTPTATLDVNGTLRVRTITTDNNLTAIAVVDADGTVKTRELSTMLPNDIFTSTAVFDPVSNILTITMSNGNTFDIDLSDLQDDLDTKLIDADGDTFVEVERAPDDDVVRFGAGGVDVLEFTDSQITAKTNVMVEAGMSLALRNIEGVGSATNEDHTIVLKDQPPSTFNVTSINYESGDPSNIVDILLDQDSDFVVNQVVALNKSGTITNYTIYAMPSLTQLQVVQNVPPSLSSFNVSWTVSGTNSIAGDLTLLEPSTQVDGKIFEIVANQGGTANVAGTGYILGEGQTFDFVSKQTSYIKLQVDQPNNRYILLEQDRTFGFLIDTTAPASGTSFSSGVLVGLFADDIDVFRDGTIEMQTTYSLNSATGELTVVGEFEGETLRIRMT